MNITDPRVVTRPFFAPSVERLLNDSRDASMVALMLQCGGLAVLGVVVFFVPWPMVYVAPVYWLLLSFVLDRFTLMLHCTSHRQLFKNDYGPLNAIIPWLLGPFFGQTPNTYFAHHMGMHHREENLADDLSSTMRFKRDRLDHWLRYWSRFLVFGLFELFSYHKSRGSKKLMWRVVRGEVAYWTALVLLALYNPGATLVVLVVPLVAIRSLMMMGNWAQHSFIRADAPEDPYGASITCINTRYNRRCFNDGYHILHHVKPRCHWSEHPIEFERAIDDYGKHDAIVFDGLDYFQVWLYLMTGRWAKLAEHFVQLPHAPTRTRAEIVAFLQERVQPVPTVETVPAPAAEAA